MTARTLLCAVPQPVADPRKGSGRRNRRSLRLALALGVMGSIQGITAGPAAVATLPSALVTRPFAMAPKTPVSTPVTSAPVVSVPTVSAALELPQIEPAVPDFSFKPDQEAAPLETVIEYVIPFAKPYQAKPVLREAVVEAAEDPYELIPFNGRNVPRWLVHSILKAAHVTGVDPVYMMTLADVESSLSPEAKAPTSSAQGLFQFIDSTWLETVHLHAADYGFVAAAEAVRIVSGEPVVADKDRQWIMNLRTDPYFSALMAGELIKDVERALHAQGERELAEAELYLAHFLGAGSAVRFLEVLDQDPNMRASKLFPKAAKANAGLFMEGKGRKRRPVSVAELYNKIDSKIIRRLDRYTGIGPYLAEITRPSEQSPDDQALEASVSLE